LILLLSNKINDYKFVNSKNHSNFLELAKSLRDCVYLNECKEGEFGFKKEYLFSREGIKERY
jgi:hypothetical protein